jgi:uncharacterized protein (DUF885 family)
MTPQEIHELGLKEVARLTCRNGKGKAQVGLKTLIEFLIM